MEAAGIPSMVITRAGFSQVVANAFSSLGFAPEGPWVYEFPMEMFEAGSDLTPINENIDKVVYGLTQWEPQVKEKGAFAPPVIAVTGKDYEEALTNMNRLFLRNMWGDGLPISAATEAKVEWILTGTDLPRDKIIGKIEPRGGIATVETLAVALASAGGRPEYMPVLIASVEAIVSTFHGGWQATTCSTYPVMIVNGPIAKQIRLNRDAGLLGPSQLFPAGGAIGRAMRLLQINLGGATTGIGTLSAYGHMRYTNAVFAEDEDLIPEGWEPLNVEFGFARGTNTVTWFVCRGVNNMLNQMGLGYPSGKDAELCWLHQAGHFLAVPDANNSWGQPVTPGLILMPSSRAAAIVAELGWSKNDVRELLFEDAKVPWATIEASMSLANIEDKIAAAQPFYPLAKGEPWPVCSKPDDIKIVVAGGRQGGHNCLLQGTWKPNAAMEIKLPPKAKWDALLAQAEEDLGPLPPD